MFIRSRFSLGDRPRGTVNSDPSLTQQHFKDECDINNIISRYCRTGMLVDPSVPLSTKSPIFGDFCEVTSFHEAQNRIIEARNVFYSLPSDIRKKFDNDPAVFLSYCSDDSNLPDLVAMGLLPSTAISDAVSESDPSPDLVLDGSDSGAKPDGSDSGAKTE